MEKKISVTIFTPTYNRRNELRRLYDSLKKQSVSEFEWLIVDDGSSDDTGQIVKRFEEEASFQIRYIYKQNGGKHTAYNLGLKKAFGEIFVCVDSDDTLVRDCVERIIENRNFIHKYGGLISYKVDFTNRLVGSKFPENIVNIKINELAIVYGCTGDYFLAFDIEAARKNPFPVFDGEKFVTESVIYDRFDKRYSVFILPYIMMKVNYQEDGYTKNINKVMKNNPIGYCIYFLQRIDMQVDWKKRMVIAGKYHCFKFFAKKQDIKYEGKHTICVKISYFLGIVFWIYYKLYRRF